MDAFESIVGKILEKDGYWVKQSVKIDLTPDEKETIGGRSIPTPEIDLVAYNDRECILYECKSFLDSPGVRIGGVEGSKGYKILNNPVFQQLITSKVISAFNLSPKTKIKYGLAAGKIYPKDFNAVVEYFRSRPNYVLLLPEQIASKLISLGQGVYINDEVTMTIKILRNDGKLNVKKN